MTLEFYTTRTLLLSQRHRWRLIAENNRIVAASSEGFTSAAGAKENAFLTAVGLADAIPGVASFTRNDAR